MDKRKLISFLLALTMILSLAVGASAAETTEARVPVTLTVVNTVAPISCTVPACLPVSLVDGYVVTANNAAITNTAKTGSIKVTKVDVQAGTFEIGNYDDFSASKNSIALSINSVVKTHQAAPKKMPLRKAQKFQLFRPIGTQCVMGVQLVRAKARRKLMHLSLRLAFLHKDRA